MKNENKNQGSAWAFLFKVAGLFILFFAFPLFALNDTLHDKIDQYFDDLMHQVYAAIALLIVGLYIAYKRFVSKYKEAE